MPECDLSAALAYAELGYPVFPCWPGSKKPIPTHGRNEATTDAAQIEAWWSAHPDANIGLATDGLCVIDFDPLEDGSQNPWLKDQPERAAELAQAPLSLTPRGGKHFVFRQPAGAALKNTTSKLANKVDTRANGGYIVVPPSMVDGKVYRWGSDSLELPPDKLPVLPGWLWSALLGGSSPAVRVDRQAAANVIPEGQRDATLTSLAGNMRRAGMSESEILAALRQINAGRCRPALDDKDVRRIAWSVARYEPDQVTVAMVEHHAAQDGLAAIAEPTYALYTAKQLDTGNFDHEFLVDQMIVARQPAILGGGFKAMKTTIATDLSVSWASGTPFLGVFPAKKSRSLFMSAESGPGTLQETARRICKSKGLALSDLGDDLIISPDLPKIGDVRHHRAVEKLIRDNGTGILIFDPLYLSLLTDDPGNLYSQGRLLREISDICQACGVTFLALHHTKKTLVNPHAPPELADLSWSGTAEFARQWILLARRERYQPGSGKHLLWFSYGGSAGQSGEWCLDIDEGQAGERIWDVRLTTAASAKQEAAAEREAARMETRAKQHAAKVAVVESKVVEALNVSPDRRNTRRAIKERTGARVQILDEAIGNLLRSGRIVDAQIDRGNSQSYSGFALAA